MRTGIVLVFVGAWFRLTVLMCTRLRTLHGKLTCCSRSSVGNRSSARNRSWLRSSSRSSCGSGRCCRGPRASSSDGGSRYCSNSIRNRSSARSHSFVRNRSSAHKHSWLRSNRSYGDGKCRTDRRASSSDGGSRHCSSSTGSRSSAHNHSFVHKHSSARSRSHSCCRHIDRRRHSRFRPSRAPWRRQSSQRQDIGSSEGTPKTGRGD